MSHSGIARIHDMVRHGVLTPEQAAELLWLRRLIAYKALPWWHRALIRLRIVKWWRTW